jgi:hypothetical protein
LLPELARTINTTTSLALLRRKTPFEVWFGRKPHWVSRIGQCGDDNDDDDSDIDNNDDDDLDLPHDLVFTEIKTRVAANNARLHAQMIKANSGKAPIFELGMIATLKILPKLRLNTESMRLPVQVLEYKNRQHLLQSRHRRLSRRYQGSELNAVDATIVDIIGSLIRIAPEQKDGKDVTITLAKAVAAENGRGSITFAQKAGRTKPRQKPGAKLGAKPGLKRTQKQAKIASIDGNTGNASELVPVPKSRPKRKRTEAEVEVEELSPRRLRRRV